MRVSVSYYLSDNRNEFEYFSKYNRINAKGIKNEIKNEICKKFGKYDCLNAEEISFYRI